MKTNWPGCWLSHGFSCVPSLPAPERFSVSGNPILLSKSPFGYLDCRFCPGPVTLLHKRHLDLATLFQIISGLWLSMLPLACAVLVIVLCAAWSPCETTSVLPDFWLAECYVDVIRSILQSHCALFIGFQHIITSHVV